MDWTKLDFSKIKEFIEIIFSVASLITVGLGYKVLVYDANKRKAEVKTEGSVAEKLESESDVAKIEAVNVLITSSKELILIYKDIITKLEQTNKAGEEEKALLKKQIDQLLVERAECREEIRKIKIIIADNKNKIESLEAQLNGKENKHGN